MRSLSYLHLSRACSVALAIILLWLATPNPASAQLGGGNIRGDFGLKSGSQGPPGYYLGNFFYFYNADEVRLAGGTKISGPNLHLFANAFILSYVTEKFFFGAHWGVNIIPAILNAALDLPRLNVGTSNWGIGDSYIQPVQLGWHFKQGDAFAGYAFFAPTGRFTPGATDNTGLGMWSNEFSLGTTVYLDPGKKWHISGAGFYEIHSEKHAQDLTVGDLVTVEGGLGRAFLKGFANAGVAYFGQWKVSPDSGADVSPLVAGQKGYMLGLGPEINMPLGKNPVILTFRYLFDTRSRFSTQGDTLIFSLVFIKPSKPAKQ